MYYKPTYYNLFISHRVTLFRGTLQHALEHIYIYIMYTYIHRYNYMHIACILYICVCIYIYIYIHIHIHIYHPTLPDTAKAKAAHSEPPETA